MLTDTAVRKASKPGRLTDGRGLYLQISKTGAKLWRYKYRFGGLEKLMSFGQYPEIALVDARERHAAARKLLATGVDPMAQRKAERFETAGADARSFQTIGLAWHEQWKKDKSPRHAATVLSRLEVDVFPALGARPIDAIEAPELVAVVKAIEKREALDVARRALQTCGQIFRYGIAHGYCRRNPVADIKPADVLTPRKEVNFARIGERDLPKLLHDIQHYKGQAVTRLAMEIMLLTFPRTAELIGGRWEEMDWERSRWVIPAERMKMDTPHIIPLSRQAVDLFKALKVITGHGALMFPGDVDRTETMSNNTILGALYRMGYKGDMTGHGFRGLAATILNENDFDEEHVDLQLAHMKRNKVSAAYNHARYLKQRTEMMQWWADFIDKQRAKGVPAQ